MFSESCSVLRPFKKALVRPKEGYICFDFKLVFNLQITFEVSVDSSVVTKMKGDLCNEKSLSDFMKIIISYLGIPFNCSVESPTVYCYEKDKIVTSFSETTKKLFPLFSYQEKESFTRIEIVHDTGSSCFEFVKKVVRNKIHV